jgi:Tfp pilus assembly protein PilN
MLRLNLSTRPFYNERGVYIVLGFAGLVLAAVTVFNAWQLVSLSARQTAFSAQAAGDEARAAEMRQQALQVRSAVRQDDLEQVLAAAREANVLIDRRTFSWTQLLNQIETTLPPDVMLQSVQPAFTGDRIVVRLSVIGRRIDDIDTFMQRLEKTGSFRELFSREEQLLDNGTFKASIESVYVTPGAPGPSGAVVTGTAGKVRR